MAFCHKRGSVFTKAGITRVLCSSHLTVECEEEGVGKEEKLHPPQGKQAAVHTELADCCGQYTPDCALYAPCSWRRLPFYAPMKCEIWGSLSLNASIRTSHLSKAGLTSELTPKRMSGKRILCTLLRYKSNRGFLKQRQRVFCVFLCCLCWRGRAEAAESSYHLSAWKLSSRHPCYTKELTGCRTAHLLLPVQWKAI